MLQRDVTRTVGTLAAIFGTAAALFVVAVREREARPSASAPPSEVYARCCTFSTPSPKKPGIAWTGPIPMISGETPATA